MGKKKEEKKAKVKKSSTVDERAKYAMNIQPPDENLFKMDNEKTIGQFRFAYKTDWNPIKTQNRLSRRQNRPRRPKRHTF
ncbi:hypothetical protein HY772_04655 [Candidatus Woesearchaeota archaeon]|nr:hypothetical protein [Candidatus Woesearchaeota archaeon]